MTDILVIEDEESILMALQDDLALEGYRVATAMDGEEGLALARSREFALIILDIMLPRKNGFDVCRELRQDGISTPILILSARGQEVDRVLGLELGADDYVTKPFSPRELLARIKAILRRVQQTRQSGDSARFGSIEVDFNKYQVFRDKRLVYLTSLEFSLLTFMIQNSDRVLSRNDILDGVWGKDVYVYDRTVDTHIGHLRKKLEDDPERPRYILSVRGVGYRFSPE